MSSLLGRYEAGERQEVWTDLVAMGPQVRDPSVLPDALAVAQETMVRAATNVDTLLQRLTEMGYWFRSEGDMLRARPDSRIKSVVDEAEQKAGPLPLSLQACLLEVGSVDLCGQHPDWPPMYAGQLPDWQATHARAAIDYGQRYVYADPLCIAPAGHLLTNIREWEDDAEWREENPVEFEFAPDEFHKAAISGGPAHGIKLPDGSADPPLRWVANREGIRLVEYLRTSFSWGGFPGFEFEPTFPAEIEELKADLLPI